MTVDIGHSVPPLETIEIPSDKNELNLAFDLSTQVVGWAAGADQKPICHGQFIFKRTAKVGAKLESFDRFVTRLIEWIKPTELIVEQPLSGRGNTTARHYELLGIVRKAWNRYSGQEVHLIPVRTIKNVMLVKRGGDHTENKRIMVQKINHLLGLELGIEDNDAADAYAVLISFWRQSSKGT